MKNKVIGIFAFAVIMAFIIPASVKGQAKPNFSGTWVYNVRKAISRKARAVDRGLLEVVILWQSRMQTLLLLKGQ